MFYVIQVLVLYILNAVFNLFLIDSYICHTKVYYYILKQNICMIDINLYNLHLYLLVYI